MRSLSSLLFLLAVCLVVAPASAQLGLQQPIPRNTGEQQFNPRTASQSGEDYCGGQSMATAKSSLFSGGSNYINTIFNNVPTGAGARIVITMLQYRQNGTTNNVAATPIYIRNPAVVLYNSTAELRTGTQQRYTQMMSLDQQFNGCGATATENAAFTQTRCVLRWVYDNTPSGQNSRVSCADVIIGSREDDLRVYVRVRLASGDVPIRAQSALDRLLRSSWATGKGIDTFASVDDPEGVARLANQVRLSDSAPISVADDGLSYNINFILSSTVSLSASEMAASLESQSSSGVSNLLDLDVSEVGISSDLYGTGSASIHTLSMMTVVFGIFIAIIMQNMQ